MSAISNISAATKAWQPQRPDAANLTENLFKKLDADGQGTIDVSELASALTQAGAADSSSAAALLKGLDGDGDNKVSKEELSEGMQKLADQFEAQFNSSRTTHAAGSPPTASPDDTFAALDSDGGGSIDKAELQSALGQSGDAAAADELFGTLDTDGDEQISKAELEKAMAGTSENGAAGRAGPPAGGGVASANEKQYDAADSNEDGTVSIEERLAYQAEQAKRDEAVKGGDDAALDKLVVELAKAYAGDSAQAANSTVSVTA